MTRPKIDPPQQSSSTVSFSPRTIQAFGMLTFVFFMGFWALTGRAETTLIYASGGFVAFGQGLGALVEFRRVNPREPSE